MEEAKGGSGKISPGPGYSGGRNEYVDLRYVFEVESIGLALRLDIEV